LSHRRMIEVSRPPEYARTIFTQADLQLKIDNRKIDSASRTGP